MAGFTMCANLLNYSQLRVFQRNMNHFVDQCFSLMVDNIVRQLLTCDIFPLHLLHLPSCRALTSLCSPLGFSVHLGTACCKPYLDLLSRRLGAGHKHENSVLGKDGQKCLATLLRHPPYQPPIPCSAFRINRTKKKTTDQHNVTPIR